MRYTLLGLAALALGATASANILFDNGGMVTHPGAGFNGADVSMASVAPFTAAGYNVRRPVPSDPGFRVADRFIVDGFGWNISSITTFGYETNEATPGWTSANLIIHDGDPLAGPVNNLLTVTSFNVASAGIYRVFNGAANLGNTARPIHSITFDLGGFNLGAGTYWFSWQVEGGTSGWASYVMEPNAANPNAPTTVLGHGRQMTQVGNWQLLGPDANAGVATAFQIAGEPIPEPATMIALGLGGLALTARRRRKTA